MNREDIIKLANECGHWSGQTVEMNDVGLERFAALVAAGEREACAKLAMQGTNASVQIKTLEVLQKERARIAEAIRARGEK